MKFHIFSTKELVAKPIIYGLILLLTGCLISLYCYLPDKKGVLSFSISITYALMLFLIIIPINHIDSFVAEKLYERESFYLSLRRLRVVTANTICKIDINNLNDVRANIIGFQVLTGRDENTLKRESAGEKINHSYVKENGFSYTDKMIRLENEWLSLYRSSGGTDRALKKKAKRLNRFYKRSCKALERNYIRIEKLYGGALQNLVERDSAISNTEFALDDINSSLKAIIHDIANIEDVLKQEQEKNEDIQEDIRAAFDSIKGDLLSLEELARVMNNIHEQLLTFVPDYKVNPMAPEKMDDMESVSRSEHRSSQ